MHFLSIALVGLASISVASASDYKTWDDIVGDVPQCMTTCVDTFYSDSGLEDECGSSDEASMSCLCGASSFSQAESSAEDLSTCIQDKCDSGDMTELANKLSEFSDRFSNAEDQCLSGDYEKNAATSLVPGINALIVSGAVLLVGAAL